MNLQKIIISCCFCFLLLIIPHVSKAHTMWIESSYQGNVGQEQQVKVFFGEFSIDMITPTKKWFSDIADCKLMLLSPNGEKKALSKAQEENCYTASFTPEAEGWYLIYLEHRVKDLYEGMRITYQALSWVKVGSPTGLPAVPSPFSNGKLILPPQTPFELNTSTEVTLVKNSAPVVSQRFTLTANNGWRKSLRSGKESGKASTELIFSAKYLYEWSESIPVTNDTEKVQPEHRADYVNTCYFFRL
ncbi:hypothetical protein [Tannerella forsythia]|uniref:DUF4198 domain-containing protein n=1 Tax=Tannerella forsythia TaxID=28112 RepID=A0A3P1XKJ8_TANFO|nr:hypothetical protein [Tannerella forsythia]RRD59304.1 hypothetical protein EII40_10350 [Tannerella forsythia]